MSLRILTILLLAIPVLLLAIPLAGAQDSIESTELTPTLDLLPKGSILRNVRIPHYDQEKNPAALLRADLMKVITKNFITANKVSLTTYKPDGTRQLRVSMKAADYHVHDGILEAHENLSLESAEFRAEGRGAIFQLDSRRAFIHGPVTTTFTIPAKTSMRQPSPLMPLPMLLMGSLVMAAPEPLTNRELGALDELAKPSDQKILSEVAVTKELITRSDQLAQLSSIGFRAFAMDVGQPDILTVANDAPAEAQGGEDPEPEPEKGLEITCEGGMYVDAEKGHVVYLKKVKVTEPRFTMAAGEELKIFLSRSAEAPKVPREAEGRPKIPSFEGTTNFADIKSIVATGGVEVVKKDGKGGPATAKADTATYDAKTGDIILRGGFPTVRQGKDFVRAEEPGLYIRIYANGNVYFQPGKWKTVANVADKDLDR